MKTSFKSILFIFCAVALFSCKQENGNKDVAANGLENNSSVQTEENQLNDWTSLIKNKLKPLLQDSSTLLNTEVEPLLFSGNTLAKTYATNQYNTIWIEDGQLNKSGFEWLNLMQQTAQYGLDARYYGAGNIAFAVKEWQKDTSNRNLAVDIEMSMTNAWLLLALHLHRGAVGENNLLRKDFKDKDSLYTDALLKAVSSNKIKSVLEAFQPNHIHYKNLQKELAVLYKSKNVLPSNFSIRDHKTDSVGCMQDAMAALYYQGYLESAQVDVNIYQEALKKFQSEHGLVADGVPGQNTRKTLLIDNKERFRRVALNIERWRKEAFSFGNEYIFVNIPGYEAYVMKGENFERVHKVIVGKPQNATPEIRSEINLVVINPDWSVPQSIISKEMRGKSASYLSKYNIYQNGQKVSPGAVRWSAGGIRMVQPPGPTNALGLIKFLFPNDHSVYLHDTPSRNLFETTVRAYSHGCVRTQNPLDLGLYLLQRDGKDFNMDSIKAIVDKGNLTNFRLSKKMPVYISYFTAFVDPNNILQLYPDVYKKEEQIAAVLFFGKYDSKVDPAKGKIAIPSINAIPEPIMPDDSTTLANFSFP